MFQEKFFCGTQWVVLSGQESIIMSTQVANHSTGFGSSCPCTYSNNYSYSPKICLFQLTLGYPPAVVISTCIVEYLLVSTDSWLSY